MIYCDRFRFKINIFLNNFQENGDNNPLIKLVMAHFKENRSDMDKSIMDFIKDFCLEKMMRQELTVDNLVPPLLDEVLAATVTELTEILNTDEDIYKVIEALKAGYAKKEDEEESKKKTE